MSSLGRRVAARRRIGVVGRAARITACALSGAVLAGGLLQLPAHANEIVDQGTVSGPDVPAPGAAIPALPTAPSPTLPATASPPPPPSSAPATQSPTPAPQTPPESVVEPIAADSSPQPSTHEDALPRRRRERQRTRPPRRPSAATPAVPSAARAIGPSPGAVPVGVPNFFIDKFRIPPFLLAIYQAAGIQYDIRWEILAAINEIETDYGRNLNISSAGALGWMQFMPATWKAYGVDANQDGRKDPFNPVDAIFAAARYLKAADADTDLRKGIFAYNHADWYVDSVLMRARIIGGLPTDLISSLTGLTQAHFPIHAKARYVREGPATIGLHAAAGTPVTAAQDGHITATGSTRRLGRYVRTRDVYGNTYTYGHLKTIAKRARPDSRTATPGRQVIAGTILGRIGPTSADRSPHLSFEIRPAGRGAPRIDPKPILDGWKLLESTKIYRAKGKNALIGPDAPTATIGQIMLMSKQTLTQRVLNNPRIDIYTCGRRDIQAGAVDRRVLATLEFLAGSGLEPTVTSLTCGHGYLTSSGNVSAHSSGNAIDIAKINGIPILGHQGKGSITDITIRRLLTLQGAAKPNQIISLMKYKDTDNTLAMGDHNDHIHVGFRPQFAPGSKDARRLEAVLKPSQWIKLIDRLGRIDNPTVRVKPSKYATGGSRHRRAR